ncbi:MAG: hypothetical protein WCO29_13490 [Nostocales cyanobacterium ELA583]|jgi:hypothetical protein
MLNHNIQSIASELFQQLSEKEQESITGGYSGIFLSKQTDIVSYSSIETKISGGGLDLYNKQTSFYSLSEKILLFIPFFGGNGRNRTRLNVGNLKWMKSFFP